MKVPRSATLLILIVVLLSASAALAQQTAPAPALKDQITQLEKIAGSADTPAMKASTLRLLAIKRAQLRTSLQLQLESLRKYQDSYGSRFSAKESQSVSNLIQTLESDLRNFAERNAPVSAAAHVRHVDRPVSRQTGGELSKRNLRVASTSSAATQTYQREFSRQPKPPDPCQGIPPTANIYLDWRGGSISPSRIKRPGSYCFVLINANTILYTYGFTLSVQEVEGNPLSLLKEAVTQLKDIGTGAQTKLQRSDVKTECDLTKYLAALKAKAEDLESAVSALLPIKSGGKYASIPLETTRAGWEPIPDKFNALTDAVTQLRKQLNVTPDTEVCKPVIGDAKTALDNFAKANANYLDLVSRVRGPHQVQFSDHLDSTKGYDVVVKELYKGEVTEAGTKTYHINAAYSIISSSAGFMITQVQARSYSSVTSPNPANPTTTQNVLGVDYGSGRRVVLTALINYNFPFFGNSPLGLGLSAGPVFDISSGKADTSKFGFFAGPSIRLSEWVYVTPGAHVGEFADFPQGFAEGQVIPTGIGTPTPRKRYTTRFALGITFKVKDLVGAKSSSSSSTPATQPAP